MNIDRWSKQYLDDYEADEKGTPHFNQSLRLIADYLAELKKLLPEEGAANPDTVASSVIALAMRATHQTATLSLIEFWAIVCEAATTASPLDPGVLAKLLTSVLREPPPDTVEEAERNIQWSIRDRSEANLAREQLRVDMYAPWTFSLAFGPDARRNELDHNVLASAAWMNILGKEIHEWCQSEQKPGEKNRFTREGWDRWKRGFEMCLKSEENLRLQTKMAAERAWSRMRELDGDE
ncbi:hypothetical protein BBP40_002968 [Aspergillus hancockii]|nr:hypothetical protein BBP40_002968 [Aspergillus hancockii]